MYRYLLKNRCKSRFRISLINLILILLFPCSIAIDLINGYTQVQLGISTPIGLIFRFMILTLVTINIHKHIEKKQSIFLIIYVVFFIIIFPLWIIEDNSFISSGFNISIELDNAIRYIYNILILTFFIINLPKLSKYNLPTIISGYGAIISFAIIFSFITGWGNHSMGEDYGFGTKSFFKAGNDLGITLLYSGVVSGMYLVQDFNYTKLFKTLFILIGCTLIGSRVAMIGSFLWLFMVISYLCFLFKAEGTKQTKKIFLFRFLLIPLLSYGLYSFITFILSSFDNFMLLKYSVEGFENARAGLTDDAISYINCFDLIELIIGKGISSLYYFVGASNVGINEYRVVEADFHELIGGYGIIGLLILSLPYFYFAIRSLKLYFHISDFLNLGIVFICTSFIAIAFLGGHCFKNSMVAPIYGYIASLIYYHNESSINK